MNLALRLSAALQLLCIIAGHSHAAQPAREQWTTFGNNELWEYCFLLPLDGYVQDYRQSDVKAKHVFTHRANKKREIIAWGMERSDTPTRLSTEAYYRKYFAGAEEKGLAIEERKLDVAARRFYSWSYWSNAYYESRILEIVWLRDDGLIKLRATFPVADVPLWKARLPGLLKQSSWCK